MRPSSKPISVLRASFVVTFALSACGGGSSNQAGPSSAGRAEIAHALKYHPACPKGVEPGQACTLDAEEACVETADVGPCGPIMWYCVEKKWEREQVSCNPPEAFDD